MTTKTKTQNSETKKKKRETNMKTFTHEDFKNIQILIIVREDLEDTIDDVLFCSRSGKLHDVEAILDYLAASPKALQAACGLASMAQNPCPYANSAANDQQDEDGEPHMCVACFYEKVDRYLQNYRGFKPRTKKERRAVEIYVKNIFKARAAGFELEAA